jgi:hypothetical protein
VTNNRAPQLVAIAKPKIANGRNKDIADAWSTRLLQRLGKDRGFECSRKFVQSRSG